MFKSIVIWGGRKGRELTYVKGKNREGSWMDAKTTEWKIHGEKAICIMRKYCLNFNCTAKCTFTMTIPHDYHVSCIVMSGRTCNCVLPNMKHKRNPVSPIWYSCQMFSLS